MLVVRCSHQTLEAIVTAATSVIDKPIHVIFGGLHLLPAEPRDISRIAVALRDDWKVAWILRG